MVGIFFCYYFQKTLLKRASVYLTVEGGVSISDIPGRKIGSDLHMDVGAEGIFYVPAEGERSND